MTDEDNAPDLLRRAPKPVRPAHSPLGASGAERWMKCPGTFSFSACALVSSKKYPHTWL